MKHKFIDIRLSVDEYGEKYKDLQRVRLTFSLFSATLEFFLDGINRHIRDDHKLVRNVFLEVSTQNDKQIQQH